MSNISVTALVLRSLTNALVFGALLWPTGSVGVVIGSLVGLALGVLQGWCAAKAASYPDDARGWWLMVLDNTWSLPNTCVGSLFLALNLVFGNRVDATMTAGRTTIVLRDGVFGGFATTLGNVEAGSTSAIADHEYIHVLQARIFGPLYVPLVVLNYVVATILPYWLLYHDRVGRPITGVGAYFMRGVYPHVWNEEWAYRVQGAPP